MNDEYMGKSLRMRKMALYRVEHFSFLDGRDIFYRDEYHKIFGFGKSLIITFHS